MDQQQEETQAEQHPVISDLCIHLSKSSQAVAAENEKSNTNTNNNDGASSHHNKRSSIPLPVAAIRVLLNVIRRSEAETMMGLQADLRGASDVMIEFAKKGGPLQQQSNTADESSVETTTTTTTTRYLLAGRSHIALSSGCELFLKHVTRASLETPNFQQCKSQVLERGERFAEFSTRSRSRIAMVGSPSSVRVV